MSESVRCRGCGRRLTLPPTVKRARARCPKCLTKVEAPVVVPVTQTPDAYQVFLEQSRDRAPVSAPEPPLDLPEREVFSLDDALPPDPKPEATPPAELLRFPPPFRFTVQVLADSRGEFRGPLHGVLTPHGLFIESEPNRPLLYAPLGTRCRPDGRVLAVAFPDRRLDLRLGGVPAPTELATDTAAFLAGERPVPLPAEYRRPWWLVGVGALFAFGLAAGPIVLAVVADVLSLGPALGLAAAFAALALLVNSGIGLAAGLSTGAKIAAMAALNAALLGLFLAGAMTFQDGTEPPSPPPPQPPPAPPGEPPPPLPPSVPMGPPTHFDVLLRDGHTRLDDGPAAVTALAVLPADGGVLVAYADGTSLVWNFDQPTFEPPRLGPRAPSAVRRVAFDSTGTLALLTCDTGLVLAPLHAAGRAAAVLVAGERATALLEPNRERFAAIRNGRVHVRYLPMNLVNAPPANRVRGGFLTTVSQDETLPFGAPALGLQTPGGKPTFLAWHPGGRLLAGRPDGTIAALSMGSATGPAFASTEHRAAVRAWALDANGSFAFGDDGGCVGFWPNGSTRIQKFKTGGVAIRGLAFNPCGGELAVVDESGFVSLWHPESGTLLFEVKQTKKVSAVAYGPRDDVLLLAVGNAVEAWWLPELAAAAER